MWACTGDMVGKAILWLQREGATAGSCCCAQPAQATGGLDVAVVRVDNARNLYTKT